MLNDCVIEASKHSLSRAKERAGFNEKKARKMMAHALDRGVRSSECHYNSDKKYLQSKSIQGRTAIAYNGWCYVVDMNTNVWVTMWELPKDFGQKKVYYRRQKEKRKADNKKITKQMELDFS